MNKIIPVFIAFTLMLGLGLVTSAVVETTNPTPASAAVFSICNAKTSEKNNGIWVRAKKSSGRWQYVAPGKCWYGHYVRLGSSQRARYWRFGKRTEIRGGVHYIPGVIKTTLHVWRP